MPHTRLEQGNRLTSLAGVPLTPIPPQPLAAKDGGAAHPPGPADGPGYRRISTTWPAPTVRPPSRIAKRRPLSIATGTIKSTLTHP